MQQQQMFQPQRPMGMGGPMGGGGGGGAPGGPECKAEFLVLNDHAGHLIGKGGSVINDLRGQSGAKIDLSRGEPGQTERTITVNGSIAQCMKAQNLISMKLATVLTQLQQFHERDQGGGMQRYGM